MWSLVSNAAETATFVTTENVPLSRESKIVDNVQKGWTEKTDLTEGDNFWDRCGQGLAFSAEVAQL